MAALCRSDRVGSRKVNRRVRAVQAKATSSHLTQTEAITAKLLLMLRMLRILRLSGMARM